MKPGDRVKVAAEYGRKWPSWAHYVGEPGTVVAPFYKGSVTVKLDCDDEAGSFVRDEVEPA